jgi:hypothetical protein
MWGSGRIAPSFLTSALDGEASDQVTPRGRAPGTHWIGGRAALRVGLDAVQFRYTYTRRFFRNVANTRHDVPWLVQQMDYIIRELTTNPIITIANPLASEHHSFRNCILQNLPHDNKSSTIQMKNCVCAQASCYEQEYGGAEVENTNSTHTWHPNRARQMIYVNYGTVS